MRYKPEEKINSLIIKIENNLSEIKITMEKLFPKEIITKTVKKSKLKK